MPKIKTLSTKKPPIGWYIINNFRDTIEPTLSELCVRLREAENEPHEGKRKPESIWPILRIHHQMSRYVYELYRLKKQISKGIINKLILDVYDYCIRENYADGNLMAKWRKQGYEKLCCLMCIQQKNHNFGTTCICRVPKDKLEEGKIVECVHCGCRGCASGDI
jgi:bud site selection protein 31